MRRLISVENLYRLTWVSTLLFLVNALRLHTSAQVFRDADEWDAVYNVVRTSINVVLALCLLWVTRRARTIEGEFGWKVAVVMLFLIDWPSFARYVAKVLRMVTIGRVVAWTVFIGLIALLASTVVAWTLRRRRRPLPPSPE